MDSAFDVLGREKPEMKGREVLMASGDGSWETPPELFEALNLRHGFTLDVAASEDNHLCERFYTKEQDALQLPWDGVWFCNPPYSKVKDWAAKCFAESLAGNSGVLLVPARTDTRWFQEFIYPFSGLGSNPSPELAYIAGIVDGEGCIRIDKDNRTPANRRTTVGYNLCVSVKMIHEPTIRYLSAFFNSPSLLWLSGGSFYREKRENFRDLYRWEIRGIQAAQILRQIYPYMRTKKAQAFHGIRFQQDKEARGKEGPRLYELLKQLKREEEPSRSFVEVHVQFLKGRLRFRQAGKELDPAPFPSLLAYFGPRLDV